MSAAIGSGGECAVLVVAVDEGVAGELLSSSSGLPVQMLLDRLSQRSSGSSRRLCPILRDGAWSPGRSPWASWPGAVRWRRSKWTALAPLIDLAGADGSISATELDHLLLEAKTRGVSETDARGYLLKYAGRPWLAATRQASSDCGAPEA